MQAIHIMERQVITVTPDTPIGHIAQLLIEHRIGGTPVVDDARRVVGMVTENELFLKEKEVPFSAVKLPSLFKCWVDPAHLIERYEQARHHTAADVMCESPICVNWDDSVGQVALVMAQNHVRQVPVTRHDVLVGIISRTDLLRFLAQRRHP
jgi:CBS domain-containing protein